ncbi:MULTISPECIES: class I SAM-dependent methyltransferase [unclassified Pseudomonas]|uniref:class I SAM-dependent methyltransferase n=1 Tax=unclassified Pseudomonas TaxID=196821 RepID=UPI00070267DC|nr:MULTISPECIES: class I SAM-dependent methyltransferase [unclassified Pseudomonas]KRA21452.1 siderophore biosynthesis protein [Pseudomonas sp. Root569]MDT3233216.1 class I SAM-dependent methyltransferase [Pseudomonas sp. rhizo25]
MNVDTLLIDLPAAFPWHLPAFTDLGVHQQAPARLLAVLERQRPAVVVMGAEQLERLLDFPGLALSDLSHLEQVLFVSPRPSDWQLAERAAAQLNCHVQGFTDDGRELTSVKREHQRWCERALGHPEVSAVALHGQTLFAVPQPCAPAAVDDHLDATGAAVDQQFSATQLHDAVQLNQRLSHAALLSMLNGLEQCGLLPAPLNDVAQSLANAGIAPGHRPLIARWLDVLQAEDLLRRQGDHLHPSLDPNAWSDASLDAIWAQLSLDWEHNTGGCATLDYARDNARQLPALMRGDCAAVHLLFPEGRTERAAALYRESLAAQYQHRAVAHWIGAWAARQSTEPLRVLEVGAGTGSTTQAVLPVLANLTVDYLCTDVSRYFSEQAAERLRAWPWVRHGVFDIDRPAVAQGYPTQSWDLIVAGGVLNAARDTQRSLSTLLALLKPGGWLVFSEPTQEEFWVMASQAFMLNQASDERALGRSTFLNLEQWQTALARAGFQGNRSLPAADHPLACLGHRVFVAQVPSQRLSRAALAAHLEHPDLQLELLDHLPDLPNVKDLP